MEHLDSPKFGKIVIGCFVRFFYNVPQLNETGQKPLYKYRVPPYILLRTFDTFSLFQIVQVVGFQDGGALYPIGKVQTNRELKLEWEREIISSKLTSISDNIPSQEEFKEWLVQREQVREGGEEIKREL